MDRILCKKQTQDQQDRENNEATHKINKVQEYNFK